MGWLTPIAGKEHTPSYGLQNLLADPRQLLGLGILAECWLVGGR